MNIFVDVSKIKIFQMELLENFMIENNIEYEKIYTIKSIDDRDKEIERLHSIIKEVREYIKQTGQYLEDTKRFKVDVLEPNYLNILEILDKVGSEKE